MPPLRTPHSAPRRHLFLGVVVLCALLAAPATHGQAPGPTPAPPAADTVGAIPFGRAITLPAILAEYAGLRPLPPDSTRPAASTDPALGFQGLVVDETATPSGRLFYNVFFLVWRPPPGAEQTTIQVGEQPLPGNSTAILVRADGEVIAQTRLPRRPDEVEELAVQVAQFVASRLSTR